MQSAESLKRRIEMEERNDSIRESPSGTTTIKAGDDSNSSEILVFTSLCNVYKAVSYTHLTLPTNREV